MKHAVTFPGNGRRTLLPAIAAAILAFSETGAAAGPDTTGDAALKSKSGCHLFNPTPAGLLREFSPDRPDKTEGPATVDAGHFQLEMDFANLTLDRADGVSALAWNVAPFNVRIGLLNNVELSLIFDSYIHVRSDDRAAGTKTIQSGIGDFTPRLKINLWGNDGGQTAFAILPFMKFPTNTDHLGNNSVEGGVLFPFSAKLPAGFDMGLETGISFLRNDAGRSYHQEFVNSVTFGHTIIGRLDGYLEFFSSVSTEEGTQWVGTVDFGVKYTFTENLQVDCGCNVGVTHAADDMNAFTGISVRF